MRSPDFIRKISAVMGAALGTVSCISMITASIVGLFGFLGVGLSTQFIAPLARIFDPLWPPLLLVSLLLILFGLRHRGRLALALATGGGLLTFVGMSMGSTPGTAHMLGMFGMSAATNDGPALAIFWLGIVLVVAGFVAAYRRHRLRRNPSLIRRKETL